MATSSRENEWVPPPPLKPERAAALIRSSFPAVDTAAIRYLGSGGQFDTFLSADRWVFRFPRWDWSGTLFEQEARVHGFLAEVLPSQLRLPRVELLATPTREFPRPFAGHRFIPGVGAGELHQDLLPAFQREIATFLAALHSTPAPVAGAAGIHEPSTDDDRRAWIEHGIAAAMQLRGLDSTIDDALAWLATKPSPPPLGGPLHVVHGDLRPAHLLVDPVTGFLKGVIDWTDTHLGDAARDFVFLVTWQGWHFTEEVLRLYTRAVDREFRARLRYMSQLFSLIWMAFAHEQGEELTQHVRAVRHAFAPAEGADRALPLA